MDTKTNKARFSFFSFLPNLLIVGTFLVFMIWLITQMLHDGLYPIAAAVSAVAVFVVLVYLRPRFTPMRWLGVGIAMVLLFTLYPIIYTVVISTTNMGAGHLRTKQQALDVIESLTYLPEGGETFEWAAYLDVQGDYALWLIPGNEAPGMLAKPDEPIDALSPGDGVVGELDDDGYPTSIEGYQRLERKDVIPILDTLGEITFGEAPDTVRIRSLSSAASLQALYKYDEEMDTVINQQTGDVYQPVDGTFTSESGEELIPGYITSIGLHHFELFLGNPGYRDPLGRIFLWSLTFAVLSVALSWAVGLIVTIMFDDLPGKRYIRALLIIPWPIPVLISVLIWRSLLQPDVGVIPPILRSIIGSSPAWFQDPFWTRFALVLVNVWLSYPYFYVITAGALRSIPEEIYAAAVVDGADAWKKFRYITFPLLLRILTPLLIASFTFNFNNFNLIYIFNQGNPPMPGTIVPMGYTDILISFVFKLAFVNSNVANYGLAAAITIILFLFVSVMVIVQVRSTKIFAEE